MGSSDIRIMSQMTVYQAINEMRRLSAEEKPFAFSFMSYSESKQTSSGVIEVRNARLRRRTPEADFLNAEMIEEYVDLDTLDHRRFYQPALMTFNGQRLILT